MRANTVTSPRYWVRVNIAFRSYVDAPIEVSPYTYLAREPIDDDDALDAAIAEYEREIGAGRYAGYVISAEVSARGRIAE